MKIRQIASTPAGTTLQVVATPSIPVTGAEGWTWIDVDGADADDIEQLGETLGLDSVSLSDVTSPAEFPKVDEVDQHLFIVTHSPGTSEVRLTSVELDIFLTAGLMITFHGEAVPGLEWTIERALAGSFESPGAALAEVLENAARRSIQLVDVLDEQVVELEALAIGGEPEVVGRVQDLRRDAILLRRVIAPERDMIRHLCRVDGAFDPRVRRRLEGVHDDYVRVVESLDAARSMLAAVHDTYRSTVAERTNEAMKVLTVFSAIILPLSLIAGIYGMNFDNMPELNSSYGYIVVLVVMAVMAAALWVYFAQRGLIGGPRIPRVDRAIGRGLAGFIHLTLQPVRTFVGNRPGGRGSNDDR